MIVIGERFVVETYDPWSGPDRKGIQIVTMQVRVTAVYPTRFEYIVERVLAIQDPLPGADQRGRVGTSGGMDLQYAAVLLANEEMAWIWS